MPDALAGPGRRAAERGAEADLVTDDSAAAFQQLLAVLAGGRLTGLIAELEHELLDADGRTAVAATADAGIGASLLTAALLVRRDVGRLNDLIHACAATLALPPPWPCRASSSRGRKSPGVPRWARATTRPARTTWRPTAASRKFKLAQWTGFDAMRKRTLFQDLVHLAAADTGRRAELYAVGPAAHVRLIDISEVLPEVAAAEAGSAAITGSESGSSAPASPGTPPPGAAPAGHRAASLPADARRSSRDGARQEILAAAHAVVRRAGRAEFTMPEVIAEMQRRGTGYAEATIRTMISAHLCAEATGAGVAGHADLTRVGLGLYRFARPHPR